MHSRLCSTTEFKFEQAQLSLCLPYPCRVVCTSTLGEITHATRAPPEQFDCCPQAHSKVVLDLKRCLPSHCCPQSLLCLLSRHDRKLKFKGKKAQKKGQKPRNPLNTSFQKSNTKLSKANSFKKKNKRKH